ncbi:recombination protein NinB [Bradyrhizobium sp. 2]|uniref:recombination protein NinB n=1 Tax=Bradyrhizobium sp. 2 TaxID=190045 RepID=UPI001FF8DD2C|nr:recombination protein NinB [Bradyrhizobium sp. 2]MCK1459129.1 recombination protein NinB [Bradyrhizobium sp. 2]MCK1459194.1 recombination protein NinB [Bradyrhizobium sp. 2]
MTNSRATVQIKNKADRNLIARWAAGVPDGTTVEFRAPRRSNDANAMMWSLLTQISKQLKWCGEHRTAEDWKDLTTAALRHAKFVPGLVPGTVVPLGMRTSQMTSAEISELIESIVAFGTENGVKFREFEEVAA